MAALMIQGCTSWAGLRPERTLDQTLTLLADAVDEHPDTALLRQLTGFA